MNNYAIVSNSKNGKLGISTFVFKQIAIETLQSLAENELKDKLILSYKKKKFAVDALVDKRNKITINCLVFFTSESDVQGFSRLIQEKITNAVINQTEISSLTVNISIGSIVTK